MRDDFPLPDLDWSPGAGFWEAAARHQLALPRCDRCRAWVWYPEPRCPRCGHHAMPWTPTSGRGTLYSWTVVEHTFLPAFASIVPYVVGLVELHEDKGVRVAARILVEPDRLQPDLALTVVFRTLRFSKEGASVTAPFFLKAE
jgi:uncharacterized OB-fold protein